MAHEEATIVGAVFENRQRAAMAAAALRSRNLAGAKITEAVWNGDGYVIDTPAGQEIRSGLSMGAPLGAVIGFLVLGLVGIVAWSSVSDVIAFLVIGSVGAIAGAVLGGYYGVNRHRPLLWDERDWTHVGLDEGEVLVVVGVDRPSVAASTLETHGGRLVEPVHPR